MPWMPWMPWSPWGPVGPVMPWMPWMPWIPWIPWGPVGPVGPNILLIVEMVNVLPFCAIRIFAPPDIPTFPVKPLNVLIIGIWIWPVFPFNDLTAPFNVTFPSFAKLKSKES